MIEIKKLYAFVAVHDGAEKVMTNNGRDFVTPDAEVIARVMPEIKELSRLTANEIRLVEFERKEGFEVIKS